MSTPIIETCRVCGCHDSMACMHEALGACAWDEADRRPTGPICTYCSSGLKNVERPWQMPRWWVEWNRGANSWQSKTSVHAADQARAQQLIQAHYNQGQLPPVVIVSIERVPNFVAQTTPGLDLTWWEDVAVQYALDATGNPDERDLSALVSACHDNYAEAVGRDGEGGPRPGTINYELNADHTQLIMRGKGNRKLMIVSLESLNEVV